MIVFFFCTAADIPGEDTHNEPYREHGMYIVSELGNQLSLATIMSKTNTLDCMFHVFPRVCNGMRLQLERLIILTRIAL
jgi:hypothetical protein